MVRKKINQSISLLFSKTIDPTTPEGGDQDRYRRALLTSISVLATRIVNILVGIATIPIMLHYLEDDLFGLWAALTSFLALMSFSDFGLGTGLRNLLIQCAGNNDTQMPKVLVSSALSGAIVIALVLVSASLFVAPLLPWDQLIICQSEANSVQILPTVQAMLIALAIGIPVGQMNHIEFAYQRGYRGYTLLSIGKLLSLVGLAVMVYFRFPLWAIAFGIIAIPNIALFFGWFLLVKNHPGLRPSPFFFSGKAFIKILHIGIFVVFSSLFYAATHSLPPLIISNAINTSATVPYSVSNSLMGASTILTASVTIGFLSAMGEAWHRNELTWVKNNIKRCLAFVGITTIPILLLFFVFGQRLVLFWTQKESAVPTLNLLAGIGVFYFFQGIRSVFSNFLTVTNHVHVVAWNEACAAFLFAIIGYIVCRYSQSVEGFIWVYAIFASFVPAMGLIIRAKKIIVSRQYGVPKHNVS